MGYHAGFCAHTSKFAVLSSKQQLNWAARKVLSMATPAGADRQVSNDLVQYRKCGRIWGHAPGSSAPEAWQVTWPPLNSVRPIDFELWALLIPHLLQSLLLPWKTSQTRHRTFLNHMVTTLLKKSIPIMRKLEYSSLWQQQSPLQASTYLHNAFLENTFNIVIRSTTASVV